MGKRWKMKNPQTKKNLNSLKNTSTKPQGYLSKLEKHQNSSTKENLWNVKNVVSFAENKLGIKLDDWQKEYINTEGKTAVRAGRQ